MSFGGPLRAHTRRSPLVIVSQTYQQASHAARERGLTMREWVLVSDIENALYRTAGIVDGRYIFAGIPPYWTREIIAVLHSRNFRRED